MPYTCTYTYRKSQIGTPLSVSLARQLKFEIEIKILHKAFLKTKQHIQWMQLK